jgi:hypothetical protein
MDDNRNWTVSFYTKRDKLIERYDILNRNESQAEKEAIADMP